MILKKGSDRKSEYVRVRSLERLNGASLILNSVTSGLIKRRIFFNVFPDLFLIPRAKMNLRKLECKPFESFVINSYSRSDSVSFSGQSLKHFHRFRETFGFWRIEFSWTTIVSQEIKNSSLDLVPNLDKQILSKYSKGYSFSKELSSISSGSTLKSRFKDSKTCFLRGDLDLRTIINPRFEKSLALHPFSCRYWIQMKVVSFLRSFYRKKRNNFV